MTQILISHSHIDKAIIFKLVDFLLMALRLEEEEILCISNSDQELSYSSSSITDQLKERLKNSEALIILITAESLHSAWIPFEAGSFWITDKPIIPILGPGLKQNDLPGQLKNFLSIPIEVQDAEDKLNNAINQLANHLHLQQKSTRRRNYKLKEFLSALKAWQPKRPKTDLVTEQNNEQLKEECQEIEATSPQDYESARSKSENISYDVFISYASQEIEFAKRVAETLKQRNLSIWLDIFEIKSGDYWAEKIREAISKSRFILMVVSPRFLSSDPWISKEWTSILERRWEQPEMPVFLVRLDNAKPPPFLRGLHSIRCGREQADVDKLVDEILIFFHDSFRFRQEKQFEIEEDESFQEEVSLRFSQLKKAIESPTAQKQETSYNE